MKLREWRKKNGVSQSEMGRLLGKTRETIRLYEIGEIYPTPETAQLIVAETENEVSYEDLYGPKAAA